MAIFRTKARAVELLGKGQIADLSTAISELWKNGYDAYASELGCDLYMPGYMGVNEPIFTLYDNGFGMTKEDILSKWIILGTDSKAHDKNSVPEKDRFGLQERVPMGEKGIGRLSVSYLGSPMLMLTKKKGMPTAALFIDWRILDNYDLYVDEVEIPVEIINPGNLEASLDKMVFDFQNNFVNHASTWKEEQKKLLYSILNSLTSVAVPGIIEEQQLNKFNDINYHGTTFVVFEPTPQLLSLGKRKNSQDDDNPNLEIQRSLSGLYNIFVQEPNFTTSFKIRDFNGVRDIIDDFFTRDDFNYADHLIKGTIDDEGRFVGEIKVFNQTIQYDYRRPQAPGKTLYGPIEIGLGVVEARQHSSLLSTEKYLEMDKKTDDFGGLYLYRDKFRVLPYGRPDYDFLGFEERRNKRAGEYFFSYRKMFGYIAITREQNKRLKDKAGREGLIDNEAYRQFKQDLIALFVDIARNYFKSQRKNEEGNVHSIQQKQIEAQNKKIIDAEKKKANKEKLEFRKNLIAFSKELDFKITHLETLNSQLKGKADALNISYLEYTDLMGLLADDKEALKGLWLEKPKFSKLTENQKDRYLVYCNKYDDALALVKSCDDAAVKIRRMFDIEYLKKDFENNKRRLGNGIHSKMAGYLASFSKSVDNLKSQFSDEEESLYFKFMEDADKISNNLHSKEEYEEASIKLDALGEEVKNSINAKYKPFIEHVENLNFDVDDDYLVAWHKMQEDILQQRLNDTYELAQLGISVEIINHELNNYYQRINYSLGMLSNNCKTNLATHNEFMQLVTNFQYLESNYKMLQPLYRSARKMKTMITGEEIFNDMRMFFSTQFRNENIEFETDDRFKEFRILGLKSVFSSVFVNIINNAIYWLQPVNNRKIRIEYNESKEEILIMNNGDQIPDRLLQEIFTLFFTRKKGGRGIGLYLAKRSLNSMELDIIASNNPAYNKLGGACFMIRKYNNR